MELRDLPSVDELARDERLSGEPPRSRWRPPALRSPAHARRSGPVTTAGDLGERALRELASARAPGLRRALNATGVIVHTNLGRAPLPEAALDGRSRSAAATRTSSTTSRRRARLAAGSRRGDPPAPDRRRGRARRQQQRAAVMLALAALAEAARCSSRAAS
jgi:L-seryl-tRNA(Ser) seleniumtransferase